MSERFDEEEIMKRAGDSLKSYSNDAVTSSVEKNKALAEKYNCRYIDVNRGLCDENGEQKEEYAIDGVHMYANAYRIVFENLKPFLL